MDKKTFVIAALIILVGIPLALAVASTYLHPAYKISDGKDIDLNGRRILNGSNTNSTVNFNIGNGSAVVSTGVKGWLRFPYDGNISADMCVYADQVGNLNVTIDKATNSSYPVVRNRIGYINLTGQQINCMPPGNGTINRKDVLYINVTGEPSLITRANVAFDAERKTAS